MYSRNMIKIGKYCSVTNEIRKSVLSIVNTGCVREEFASLLQSYVVEMRTLRAHTLYLIPNTEDSDFIPAPPRTLSIKQVIVVRVQSFVLVCMCVSPDGRGHSGLA